METIIITAPVLAVVVNGLVYLTSKYVLPRWGATGVQVMVAFFATIGALFITYRTQLVGLEQFLITLTSISALAITFYEVIWKKVGKLFK